MSHLTYLEAGVIGLVQGVSELFPVSSLGHSVLIPALVGGTWKQDLNVSRPESPYLAFIVGLHVATALALIVFYRRDWLRILRGLASSVRHRRIDTADARLAWLLILATIPVGVSGLLLEHLVRTTLGRPVPAALFLILNGVILFAAERFARSAPAPMAQAVAVGGSGSVTAAAGPTEDAVSADGRLARMSVRRSVLIGCAQIAALAPGISRSGATMGAGLRAGLSREDATRFAFLLATPVILAAGVLKLPDLFGPLGAGIHGQVLFGSVLSGLAAYAAVAFLDRYVRTRSLRPFGWYCIAAGIVSLVLLAR